MGGSYPHEEVSRNPKATKIQKGIFYSPNNEFFAFDILLNRTDFLSVTEANQLFETAGLLHAKTIFKGPITECLAHPNDFHSTVPADLGLPEITPNIIEGVVIRPVQPRFFNNGTRVILKNKNEKWSERIKLDKTLKPSVIYSEKVLQLQEVTKTYATENRLSNVLSKVGEVTTKDFGKILGMFNKDILEDFQKDYQEVLATLEKKEQKSINKSLGGVTTKLVRKRLVTG
ncbi:MAG: RNA ligase family protein [Saprospiraceae bacterium]